MSPTGTVQEDTTMHSSSASGQPRTGHTSVALRVLAIVALAVGLGSCSSTTKASSSSERIITVTHAEVPKATIIDNGDTGPSVGDVRLWHFDGQTDTGDVVNTDWIMTTTAVDMPAVDVETRITTGVFRFGDLADQIILQGVGLYPAKGATLKVSSSVVRSIIGGSGKYAGASGWVESTHLDDGTWTHVFHLQ
ncbi:MAG: hypothetical protein F2789_09240 [Actinobacteria bacterium]|nr:hypothetical protein [Actinomycetota bacterium]